MVRHFSCVFCARTPLPTTVINLDIVRCRTSLSPIDHGPSHAPVLSRYCLCRPPKRPAQFHNNGSDRSKFSSHGSQSGNGWVPGQGQERFPPHGFGSAPSPGVSRGSSPPPQWFDGQQQMHPGNRQKFGPGPAGGQGRGGGAEREGATGGVRRSRSPAPRDGPSDKMARLR